MSQNINQQFITELDSIKDSQTLIAEILKRFGNRAAIGTAGQLSGVVMIDLAVKAGVKPRVFTIDTLRLFKETYELFDQIEKKYQIKVERIPPQPQKLQKMIAENGEYLFFDNPPKQELCCHIRKVEPNNEVLKSVDVWLTGLRKDQSQARAKTNRFKIVTHEEDKHPILKVAPLLEWTENQLWDYIRENEVPVHKLLTWNENGWRYESLGCMICTTPISPTEPRRAGRWRWFNALDPNASKECGLHIDTEENEAEK